VRIGGTKNGSVISTSSAPRAGVLVRAMIQPNSNGERQRKDGLEQRDADRIGEQHGGRPGQHLAIAGQVEGTGNCRAAWWQACRTTASTADRARETRAAGSAPPPPAAAAACRRAGLAAGSTAQAPVAFDLVRRERGHCPITDKASWRAPSSPTAPPAAPAPSTWRGERLGVVIGAVGDALDTRSIQPLA